MLRLLQEANSDLFTNYEKQKQEALALEREKRRQQAELLIKKVKAAKVISGIPH